jgi:hypothetical protein
MGQRLIFVYLARKGLAAVAIDEDLVPTLGEEAISYPSVKRSFREAKLTTSNSKVTLSQPIPEHNDCDQAILLALDE